MQLRVQRRPELILGEQIACYGKLAKRRRQGVRADVMVRCGVLSNKYTFRKKKIMAEPALRQKRAEPFGQRASAHVHVHAHTLASQGGLRSLLRTTGNMGLVGARRQRGV